MIIAELPPDEELRLIDLASYEIIDTPDESEFDDLVELAAQICNSRISLISLLDKNQQWFKAKKGTDQKSTSRDVAFCAHAILQDEIMQIEDASQDERFFDNPLVAGEMDVRFYAGTPIISPEGFKLGTICVIDNQPRKLLPEQKRALKILAKQVTKLLELRKKNLQLRKRAAEMISLKSKTISRVLLAQEINKKEIAHSLHEDLAQSLVSGIMFLQLSADNTIKDSPNWITAQQQLNNVLTGIRNLSYAIVPPAINFIPAEELVKEFVERIEGTFLFDIRTEITGQKTAYTGDKAIVAIRIIEQWLKVLANKKDITEVVITLKTSMPFEINIEDDGPLQSFNEISKEVFDSMLFDIAQSYDGIVEHTFSAVTKNSIKISFPVAALAVA